MDNTQQRIAEVEAKRDAAVQAERERIAKETAAAREIADADAELIKLRADKEQADLAALRAQNVGLVEAAKKDAQVLYPRLESIVDAIKFAPSDDPLQWIRKAYERQTAHAERVIKTAEDIAWREAQAEYPRLLRDYGSDDLAKEQVKRLADKKLHTAIDGLKAAISPVEALAVWVNKATTPQDRTLRVLVASAMVGQPIDPAPGYTPNEMYHVDRYR